MVHTESDAPDEREPQGPSSEPSPAPGATAAVGTAVVREPAEPEPEPEPEEPASVPVAPRLGVIGSPHDEPEPEPEPEADKAGADAGVREASDAEDGTAAGAATNRRATPAPASPEPSAASAKSTATGADAAATTVQAADAHGATASRKRRLRFVAGPASDGAGDGQGPRRVPRPMVAAAAVAGTLLIAVPFVVSSLGQGTSHRTASRDAAWNRDGNGPGGFVPRADPSGQPVPGASSLGAPGTSPGGGAPGPGGKSVASGGGTARGDGSGGRNASTPSGKGSSSVSGAGHTAAAAGGGGSADHNSANSASSVIFSAVAGPHCSNSTTMAHENGYYSDGESGWTTSSSGYSGSGCDGTYVSLPMSGNSSDGDNNFEWMFNIPAAAHTCQVSLYIPDSSDVRKVGGDPSYYTVYRYFDETSSNQIATFQVSQVAHRGAWVNVGSYPVTEKKLAVELHDRGVDWSGNVKTYDHHAASAAQVSCTA